MEKKATLYEYETQRTNITPKAFFGHVKRELKRKCGIDLAMWCDNFDAWSKRDGLPSTNTRTTTEVCKTLPFEWQFFLQGAYNFILEFDFWDDKTGFGYCYIHEYER